MLYIYLRVVENPYITVMALVGFSTSAQGRRVKIRAPGQSGHGPSHIEQLRAQYIYFHKLTMLTVGPAGPLKVAGPLGICPLCPPPLGGPASAV